MLIKKIFDLKVYASIEDNEINLIQIKTLRQRSQDLITSMSANEVTAELIEMVVKSNKDDDLAEDVCKLVKPQTFDKTNMKHIDLLMKFLKVIGGGSKYNGPVRIYNETIEPHILPTLMKNKWSLLKLHLFQSGFNSFKSIAKEL